MSRLFFTRPSHRRSGRAIASAFLAHIVVARAAKSRLANGVTLSYVGFNSGRLERFISFGCTEKSPPTHS
jgi:hypothetical protein